jgi:hypothetical protein
MENGEHEQMDRLNNQAINRKAKEMLIRSGEQPEPRCLHCVQLACWALDRDSFSVEDAIYETVRAMTEWRPARLMNFLLNDASTEYTPKGWDNAQGPEELARAILQDIEARAYATFPWYASVTD